MVQEQLVDYINAQLKLGTSRDAIKATLTGAGWVAADVEDTLKKIEPMATVAAVAPIKPAESFIAPKTAAPAITANPQPQTIKVSDLVSSSSSSPVMMAAKPAAARSPMTGPVSAAATPVGTRSADTFQASSYQAAKPRGSRGALITEIVLGVIILAVGALAGFLYMQNNSLNAQLSSLNGQSSGVNSQLSTLQAAMVASTTALTAQVSSLTAGAQELQTELSFFVVSSSTTPGVTSIATLGGTVAGGGKVPYVITTPHGAKIYIMNIKSASVAAALTPLLAGTSTPAIAAQFSGTYVPGSDGITLTAVNSTAVQ